MGGMSAQIPIKNDPKANEIAMEKVRADKLREVTAGHDGTWIAHPLIHNIARKVFDEHMLGPNQYHVRREDVRVAAADLTNANVPGKITEDGVRSNVSVALAYSTAWLGGNGCIPVNHLMEDAATAEIARVQLVPFVDHIIDELAPTIKSTVPGIKEEHLRITTNYLKGQIRQQWPSDFLTSDLMPFLTMADGVELRWQPSFL